MDSRGHLALCPSSQFLLRCGLSAAMAKAPKQLLNLPDEILNFVAEAINNGTSLGALARTCRAPARSRGTVHLTLSHHRTWHTSTRPLQSDQQAASTSSSGVEALRRSFCGCH
jgi:hypothetical protein